MRNLIVGLGIACVVGTSWVGPIGRMLDVVGIVLDVVARVAFGG